MKIKTFITLPEYLLKAIDNLIDEYGNRSRVIEVALREFIVNKHRQTRHQKDLKLINGNTDSLNEEAVDTLSYQVKI